MYVCSCAVCTEIAKLKQQRDSEHRRWRAERMQANTEIDNVRKYVSSLEDRLSSYEGTSQSSNC